jgi:hypothetical protein
MEAPCLLLPVEAGQGEVSQGGGAVMLPGDDVVDGESVWVGRLGEAAVFASIGGPLADQSDQALVHERVPLASWSHAP